MQQQGWISLHRSLQEHWIWKNPIKLKWWLDILLTVNYIDGQINIGNELITCKRGQSLMSLQSWATRWNVSKDTVRSFFKLLEKDGMICQENIKKTTRITVCNYDSYQDVEHDEQTHSKRTPNAFQTHSDPNNKDNNILLSKDSADFEKKSELEKIGISNLKSEVELLKAEKPKRKREAWGRVKKSSIEKNTQDAEKAELNKKAGEIFKARYFLKFNTPYYWTAKDAGSMSRLIQAIQYNITQDGKIADKISIEAELVSILNTAANDKWLSEHFSVANIYSNFNKIEADRKIKYNQPNNIPVYGIK